MSPSSASDPLTQLAALMLAQGWDRSAMRAAARIAWDTEWQRIDRLIDGAMARWPRPYPPCASGLAGLLEELLFQTEADLDAVFESLSHLPLITQPPVPVGPIPAFEGLALPRLQSPSDLAEWLGLTERHLDWFADCDGRLARGGPDHLRHYQELWLRKRSGGLRLLEAPLPKLKEIQRKILHGILDIVPIHPAAHGFTKGRDCCGHAAQHAGEAVVLTLDLKDFFPSIGASRVHAIFRCLGYPHAVSRLLTGLVTTQTPPEVLASLPGPDHAIWRMPHLPQGAPTSPCLANLAANALDLRLTALAQRMEARYSRYADDLAFSGSRGLAFDAASPVLEQIAEIVTDCGFRLHPDKTRIQRQGRRQQVTGIVVNQHLNLPRHEFDRLKAILTNCVRHGPSGQNHAGHADFQAYLTGRAGWVAALNPRRGAKLFALLDRINWQR